MAYRNKKTIEIMTDIQLLLDFLHSVAPLKTEHKLIRFGPDSDGGYLVPDDLAGVDTCFSPGVSEIAGFEEELTHREIKCFLADYSVDRPPVLNSLFDFEKKFIGAMNDDIYMTLDSWVKIKASKKNNMILQMDIESSEYPVLLNASEDVLKRFRIMIIEFHLLDQLLNQQYFHIIRAVFSKILKHFDIVHIHPNNCCKEIDFGDIIIPPVMEFTFLRKDRIKSRERLTDFPNFLDFPNLPNKKDIVLPKCWYL